MRVVQGIRDGGAHLHSPGLVYNGPKPFSIIIAEDGTGVVIVFDLCRPAGEPMGMKGSTLDWGVHVPNK
jgi:hypothetical protein